MFYWIGLIVSLYIVRTILVQLFNIYEMATNPAPFEISKFGEWSLITGCTDGIGKQYAIQLAQAGARKFVLIGRNEKKLADTIDEIKKVDESAKFEFETRLIDFATFTDYASLADLIDSRGIHFFSKFCWFFFVEIGVFINSVGVSFPLPQHLHDVEKMYPGKGVRFSQNRLE